jgi:hypothetical protein
MSENAYEKTFPSILQNLEKLKTFNLVLLTLYVPKNKTLQVCYFILVLNRNKTFLNSRTMPRYFFFHSPWWRNSSKLKFKRFFASNPYYNQQPLLIWFVKQTESTYYQPCQKCFLQNQHKNRWPTFLNAQPFIWKKNEKEPMHGNIFRKKI